MDDQTGTSVSPKRVGIAGIRIAKSTTLLCVPAKEVWCPGRSLLGPVAEKPCICCCFFLYFASKSGRRGVLIVVFVVIVLWEECWAVAFPCPKKWHLRPRGLHLDCSIPPLKITENRQSFGIWQSPNVSGARGPGPEARPTSWVIRQRSMANGRPPQGSDACVGRFLSPLSP
jgi:hypothetical protein